MPRVDEKLTAEEADDLERLLYATSSIGKLSGIAEKLSRKIRDARGSRSLWHNSDELMKYTPQLGLATYKGNFKFVRFEENNG